MGLHNHGEHGSKAVCEHSQERYLQLSRKKTRIGAINSGFHFLGIQYLETQSPNNILTKDRDTGTPAGLVAVLDLTETARGL